MDRHGGSTGNSALERSERQNLLPVFEIVAFASPGRGGVVIHATFLTLTAGHIRLAVHRVLYERGPNSCVEIRGLTAALLAPVPDLWRLAKPDGPWAAGQLGLT